MDKHVQKIQQELEEAKDKLEKQQHKRVRWRRRRGRRFSKGISVPLCRQRDSGDDEDMDKASEDEEGQLEEQIERLQEKVESAQSEQKNLFLVIFQVAPLAVVRALNARLLASPHPLERRRSASSCC